MRWIGAGGDRFTNVAEISEEMARNVGGYFGVMKGVVDKGGKTKVATDVVGDMLSKGSKKAPAANKTEHWGT